MPRIAVIGTLDTKGHEHRFLADAIRARGHQPVLIDVGTAGPPQVAPDIDREQVWCEAGTDGKTIMARADRGECVSAMSRAAPILLARLAAEQAISGVVSLGGGGGTAIASAAMRGLPIGFPKLLVSTMASGNTAPYLGSKDITMMPAIVDIAGLNRISRMVFRRAASVICAMVDTPVADSDTTRPIIVASMFGNTTECIGYARDVLEQAGYEVLVFHATGSGGRAMEDLIASGLVRGVLDITTTEWADELVGGVLSAGPQRLDAAAQAGVATVIAPGCLDMVNFGAPGTIPTQFKQRTFYEHNPQVTLMRTNPQECEQLGRILAEKANGYQGPVSVLIPRQALSLLGAPGQPFHDHRADESLFEAIKRAARVPVVELEEPINSRSFAEACARELLANLEKAVPTHHQC